MIEIWTAAGAGGVIATIALLLIKWLINHVDYITKQNAEISESFRNVIENHISENTRALDRMANVLEQIMNYIKEK